MFRCEVCGAISKPGEKCNRVVVQKRQKMYNPGHGVFHGFEIVEEKNMCATCAERCMVKDDKS